MDRVKYLVLGVLVFGLTAAYVRPVAAEAPMLTFSGPVGLIHADDLIPVDIQASSGGQTVNAAQVQVAYPIDHLHIEFVRREQSVFDLWPEPPAWNNDRGVMTLSGGHPGGLIANKSRVATIYFRALKPGPVDIHLGPDGSGLYLNDGAGTKVEVPMATTTLQLSDTLVPGIPLNAATVPTPNTWSRENTVSIGWDVDTDLKYSYVFSADCQALPDETTEALVGQVTYPAVQDGISCFTIKSRDIDGTWSLPSQYRFLIDRSVPAPFVIAHPNPASVHGENILTWNAVDTISGIASTTLHVAGFPDQSVTSPLAISPTWIGKLITITVTDEAGNIQSATWEFAGPKPLLTRPQLLLGGVIAAVALGVGLVTGRHHHRTRRRKR